MQPYYHESCLFSSAWFYVCYVSGCHLWPGISSFKPFDHMLNRADKCQSTGDTSQVRFNMFTEHLRSSGSMQMKNMQNMPISAPVISFLVLGRPCSSDLELVSSDRHLLFQAAIFLVRGLKPFCPIHLRPNSSWVWLDCVWTSVGGLCGAPQNPFCSTSWFLAEMKPWC